MSGSLSATAWDNYYKFTSLVGAGDVDAWKPGAVSFNWADADVNAVVAQFESAQSAVQGSYGLSLPVLNDEEQHIFEASSAVRPAVGNTGLILVGGLALAYFMGVFK